MKKLLYLLPALLLAGCCGDSAKQSATPGMNYNYDKMQKEQLNRGLVAIHNGDGKVSVSWRFLNGEPVDTAFDLYRKSGDGEAVKLNNTPLTKSTFFTDNGVDVSIDNTYIVKVIGSGEEAEYTLTPQIAEKPYLRIPVQPVDGFEYGTYMPADATVGDLDGDGEYEIVVKLVTTEFDNGGGGLCTEGCLLDAYELDGTFMWRVDLGLNIRQGAHYTQMSLYDFDGDGKAELAVKTAEGTKFGDGSVIGDVNGDGKTDYRITERGQRGYGKILEGPEFLSVIEGATGKELARADFIPRGGEFDFGDNTGNRVDRYLGGAGFFDGERPSILICRGYYAKTVLEAWDWRDGKLTKRWTFDTTANDGEYKEYEGQGNHNLRIGDVDGDGKDEIVYGACLIDDDGTGIYSTGLGHGDAMYLTDIILERPGLEVWQSHENTPGPANSEMRDALTGQLIWGIPGVADVGRAACLDIDPRFRGAEVWTSSSEGVYTADGRFISEYVPGTNFSIWWDGDLNREVLDGYYLGDKEFTPSGGQMPEALRALMPPRVPGVPQAQRETPKELMRVMRITKWTGDGVVPIDLPDMENIAANNGSKSNPCVSADLFGDWREELVTRTQDNKEIRIYMTDFPTDYRFYPLMSENIYRMSVLTQNIAYNQPPLMGRYLGSDLGKFWNITRAYDMSKGRPTNAKSGVAADGRKNGMHARVQNTIETVHRDIVVYNDVANEYTLDALLDYDLCEWTINGQPAGTGRTLTLSAEKYGYDKPISIGIKAVYFGCAFEDNGTLTFSSENRPR